MPQQLTRQIMMVRPAAFQYNPVTAQNNAFQDARIQEEPLSRVQQEALQEFDHMVALLRQNGVEVMVVEDSPRPPKPDAVFPNNWVSFHEDGRVFLYPMYAPNRRPERRLEVVEALKGRFAIREILDLSLYEAEEKFLESTGSLIFDRQEGYVYACFSPRTHPALLAEIGQKLGYQAIGFKAADARGQEIYHTNVMMSLADTFAVICLEAIPDETEREVVVKTLTQTHKEIVPISLAQMNAFAGNMLTVQGHSGEKLLVLSQQAYESLDEHQVIRLSAHARLLPIPLYTIERSGGGSARCMMAEIFLPELTH